MPSHVRSTPLCGRRDRRGVRRLANGARVVDFLLVFGGDNEPTLSPYFNDRIWRTLSLFAPQTE